MTTPMERTRALLWAGSYLIDVAENTDLPIAVRRRAVIIARHFPTTEELSGLAALYHPSGLQVALVQPSEIPGPPNERRLCYATRLYLPQD